MTWLRRILARRQIHADLSAEIRAHLDEKIEELVASGMPREEAEHAARRAFGNVLLTEERSREIWRWPRLEDFLLDLRYALRTLRKSPGFAIVAILTLALGIGANTAIFSAVNGILLKPLPYPESGRLVRIEANAVLPGGLHALGISLPEIRDVRAHCPAIGRTAFYGTYGGQTILGGSFPDIVPTALVSGNFFTVLGIRPLLGRPILPTDTQLGSNRVAVLSYGLWRRDFDGDLKVIGRRITIDQKPYAIIGVMPPNFRAGMHGRNRGLWVPLVPHGYFSGGRASHRFAAIARLRTGATLVAANAQLATLSARLAAAYSKTDRDWTLSAKSEKDAEVGSTLPAELLFLLAAVGLVLLIACVNVSGMLLARSWTRHREVAIREALGATRLQIVRQFLAESLLLSLAGGALGLLLAVWVIPALKAIAPAGRPRINQLRLDANVLWFTLSVSVFSAVLFGLALALRVSGSKVGVALKEGVGGLLEGFSGRGPRRLRNGLVIIEVALAVILAIGATLVARSLRKMTEVPLGYWTDHVLTVQAVLAGSACDLTYSEPCHVATQEILRRLRASHGVLGATVAASVPLDGGEGTLGLEVEGRTIPKSWGAGFNVVMPGYFRAMGISLLAGRNFTDADTSHSRRVAIVNRAFAERFLAGANPLGKRISMNKDKDGQPEWMEVVGEVADIRQDAVTIPPQAEFYMPGTQTYQMSAFPTFVLRTSSKPLTMASAVKQQIRFVDKNAPILDLKTMNQIVAAKEAGPRFRALLLGAFGVLGLLLAMVGIYGVISYAVSRRTREIGLRMALGAHPGDTLRMVIREGMVLAGAGIAIGICGALATTRLLRSYLFEIKPNDPLTFVAVTAGIALAALAACYLPARRATRVDPVTALRNE